MNKSNLEKLSKKHQVLIAAIIFFIVCSSLQWWRMESLTSSMDQGILFQILWNGLRGHPFESTLSSQLSTNVVHGGEFPSLGYHRLGQHFTPILAIWIPLIGLLGKWGLPFLQVLLITCAGLVLYELAKCRVERKLAAKITVSFYCANAVIGPCLGNFTDLSQLPICIFLVLLGIEKKKKWLTFIPSICIPLIREDAGIVLLGVGLWILITNSKAWKLAISLAVYGIIWTLLTTNLLMPLFSDDNSKRFMVENFGQYIKGKDQASSIEVITLAVQQPLVILRELIDPPGRTLRYLIGQGLPLMFIPFISLDSWLLMGLPLLGLLLAQGNPLAINWRYAYLVVPGLFAGSIYWWGKNQILYKSRVLRKIWTGCIILSLLFTLTSNPNRTLSWMIPQSIQPWVFRSPIKQWNHGQIAKKAIKIIPSQASVSASNSLVPHLAAREVLIRFPYHIQYQDIEKIVNQVEWIAVDIDEHQRYANVFRNEWEDLQQIIEILDKISVNYSPYFVDDGIAVLRLNGEKNPQINQKYQSLMTKIKQLELRKN